MRISDVITSTRESGYAVNMPRADYRDIPRLNPSSLAAGLMGISEVDPCAVRDAFEGGETSRAAAAQDRMDRGTLAHLLLLQPERLPDEVAVWDEGRRQGATWDVFQDMHAGKLIMKVEDYRRVASAINQMRAEKIVADLIRGLQPEVAVFASEIVGGVRINTRGQLDGINFDRRLIVDVKTTEAGVDQRSVERTIRDFRYREKMACYRRWLAMVTATSEDEWTCWNLFLSLGERPGIRAVEFSTGSLEFGWMRMEQALTAVSQCLRENEWPMFAKRDIIDVAAWECEEGAVSIE